MKAEIFIEKVRLMRQAQIAYFMGGRKMSDLVDAKRLEKEVDKALAEDIELGDDPEPEQFKLFDTPGTCSLGYDMTEGAGDET